MIGDRWIESEMMRERERKKDIERERDRDRVIQTNIQRQTDR